MRQQALMEVRSHATNTTQERSSEGNPAPHSSINASEAFDELIVDHVDREQAAVDPSIHRPLLLDFIIVDEHASEPPPIKPSWFWGLRKNRCLGYEFCCKLYCQLQLACSTTALEENDCVWLHSLPGNCRRVYLFAWYDILDIRDRLRAECRNDCTLGTAGSL